MKRAETRAHSAGVPRADSLEFYYHFCSEVAVAVQIGNALVLESAVQAAHGRADADSLRWPRSVVQPGSLRVQVDF